MSKRSRDTIWGIFAPITPIAPLAYILTAPRGVAAATRQMWSDRFSRYTLLALAASSCISTALAPNKLVGFGTSIVLILFLLIVWYGAWGIREPIRFLSALTLGAGFLGLVVVVSRALEVELIVGDFPILANFAWPSPRGNVLGMRSNGLAALMEPAVAGGLGLALLQKKNRALYLLASLFALAGIAVTLSRGSLLGIFVSVALLLVFLARSPKRLLIAALAIAVCVAVLLYALPGFGNRVLSIVDLERNIERVQIWTGTWHMFLDHALFGIGPGNFGEVYPEYKLPDEEKHAASPHNLYLYVLSGWGIVGFAAFFVHLARFAIRPLMRSPARFQVLAFVMMIPFWVHVLVDDIFMLHVPLIMGCISNRNIQE